MFELKQTYKADRLKYLDDDTKNSAYASANGFEMSFNDYYFNNQPVFIKSLVKNAEDRFHPIGTDNINAVIDHEFGHVLTKDAFFVGHPIAAELSKLKGEYTRALTKLRKEGKNPLESDLYISTYGQTNIDEFTAEAFAMALNSNKPSPFAIRVKELIDKYFKK